MGTSGDRGYNPAPILGMVCLNIKSMRLNDFALLSQRQNSKLKHMQTHLTKKQNTKILPLHAATKTLTHCPLKIT